MLLYSPSSPDKKLTIFDDTKKLTCKAIGFTSSKVLLTLRVCGVVNPLEVKGLAGGRAG